MKLLYNSFCLTVHLSGVPQSVHLMLLEKFNFKTRYLKKIADIIEILISNLHLKNNILGLSLMLPKTNIYIYIFLWFSVYQPVLSFFSSFIFMTTEYLFYDFVYFLYLWMLSSLSWILLLFELPFDENNISLIAYIKWRHGHIINL